MKMFALSLIISLIAASAAAQTFTGKVVDGKEKKTEIREVIVKSKRLWQRSDTLIYSVAGFRQKQDRSIADVIAKMPGLAVKDNGQPRAADHLYRHSRKPHDCGAGEGLHKPTEFRKTAKNS